jgi:phosphoglucomutase
VFDGRRVSGVDDFSYTDPVDGSVSRHQGLRVVFQDGSVSGSRRIHGVWRLAVIAT